MNNTSTYQIGSVSLWRQNLIRNLLRALAFLASPIAITGIGLAIFVENDLREAISRLGVYLVVLFVVFWRRIPHQIQAALLIGVFSIFGLVNQVRFGFNSESALFLLCAVLLASLFFERWPGQILMLVICLALVGIAWGFTSGWIVVYYPSTDIPKDTGWDRWALYILVFFGLGSGLQYAQGYLLTHLARALGRSHCLAHDLETERAGLAEQVTLRTRVAEQARHEAEAAAAALQAQVWQVAGQARLSAVLRGEHDLPLLAQAVLAEVCRYVGASVGALYLCDGDAVWLLGRYAYTPAPGQPEHFRFGEGLVGQVAQEGQLWVLADIPESQFVLASGLGQTTLRHLLVAPFAYLGEVGGVLELGSLHAFTESQSQFVKQSLEPIAIAFNTARSRTHITVLLEETRQQANALAVREEELRAINEQLQAQAENSQATKDRNQ